MKTINFLKSSFIFVCVGILFCMPLSAQLKVLSDGKVHVGIDPYPTMNDVDQAATLQIFGRGVSHGAASKLTFGDFGRFSASSWNVFVGEYGTTDTDQLWLHGKNGIYFTYKKSDTVLAYYHPAISTKFNFSVDIRANGIVLTSDARLKENVNPLTGSLSSLQRLNGVSYFLKNIQKSVDMEERKISPEDLASLTDKERESIAFFEEFDKKMKTKQLRRGFLAQDLQKVFPELVSEENDGMLSIDYIGLIPVIVESIKEQQQIINNQSERIQELEAALNVSDELISLRSFDNLQTFTTSADVISPSNALSQNKPNPFSEQTEIAYSVAVDAQSAFICIFDMNGKMLLKKDVATGNNSITIEGATLDAGMYLYSLVVDGQEIATKKMILTK